MKKPIKLYEPITKAQIKMLHSKARETGLQGRGLDNMVSSLIGISSITALSKHEAMFLIDKMHGKARTQHPRNPLWENEISGDTSLLPSFYHIRDIRLMVKELGWDKQQFKNWLVKYRKVKNVRSMDRKQARVSYFILKGVVGRKKGG